MCIVAVWFHHGCGGGYGSGRGCVAVWLGDHVAMWLCGCVAVWLCGGLGV